MKLRGIDFGRVWDQSGVRGFFGEGYPFHKIFWPFGLSFKGSTFVAKTTTLHPQKGNMPLMGNGITPQHLFPRCIVVKPFKGVVLNAVGLSGPGSQDLLDRGLWQERKEPFMLSFMPVSKTADLRILETKLFVHILQQYLPHFRAQVALQYNKTCPNVGQTPVPEAEFVDEVDRELDVLSELGIPIIPKFAVTTPVSAVAKIAIHRSCDAICVSNTVPWGQLPDHINWKQLFGTEESPLKKYGGGGLSGWPLLPLVESWLLQARNTHKIGKPIAAGGGIQKPKDAERLVSVGAQAVCVGSVSMVRPWRMQRIINAALEAFEVEEKFHSAVLASSK